MGLWKEIFKEVVQLKQNYCFELGNGAKLSFWEDAWCGETPLRLAFPSLFAISGSGEAKVEEVWEGLEVEGGWIFYFTRPFNDWEMEEVLYFIGIVNTKSVCPFKKDNDLEANQGWEFFS